MDGRQLPFPEDLPINRETLLHFASAFLSGRLQSALDARKAMVVSRPFSTHNTVRRKEKRGAPTEVRGVSEQLKPKDAITQVCQEQCSYTIQKFTNEDFRMARFQHLLYLLELYVPGRFSRETIT